MIYIYTHQGKREESNDNDIFAPRLLHGEYDDAAICEASNKKEAIEKFKKYFKIVTNKDVKSIKKFHHTSDGVSILTPY
jgi:hypothetical protein